MSANKSYDFIQSYRMIVTSLIFFQLVHFCCIKLCEKLLALRDEDINGLGNQDIRREDPCGFNWDWKENTEENVTMPLVNHHKTNLMQHFWMWTYIWNDPALCRVSPSSLSHHVGELLCCMCPNDCWQP